MVEARCIALHNDVSAGRLERTKTARAPRSRVIAATRTAPCPLFTHYSSHTCLKAFETIMRIIDIVTILYETVLSEALAKLKIYVKYVLKNIMKNPK